MKQKYSALRQSGSVSLMCVYKRSSWFCGHICLQRWSKAGNGELMGQNMRQKGQNGESTEKHKVRIQIGVIASRI